uniref:Ig-like domain-containing protein n=1 Tax=Callorhinchus milii TaxID=7868 RepID=A0A4W3I996_CALMI
MGTWLYILALLVIQCSTVWMCPSNCNCTGSLTTCCAQGADSLSQPLAGNPDTSDTKTLVLDHCGVFILDMSTFENFLPLELLEIRQMIIVYVNSQAFMHLSNLQTLILDNVSLSDAAMHPNAFAGLRANILSLRNNHLCTVTQQTFTDSENLEDIDLSGNQLRFIEDKTFAGLVKLKRLNLTNNRLKTVSLFWFGFSFLKTDFQLVLLGNNLSCECQYRGALYQGNWWFTQAIASNNLTCNWSSATPPCEVPSVATTYKEICTTELLTLSLSCGADGLPKPSVIWFLPNGTQSPPYPPPQPPYHRWLGLQPLSPEALELHPQCLRRFLPFVLQGRSQDLSL